MGENEINAAILDNETNAAEIPEQKHDDVTGQAGDNYAETMRKNPEEKAPSGQEEDGREERELEKLLDYCPELAGKRLPNEVMSAFAEGKSLLGAYREYEREKYIKSLDEKAKLEAEISIYRQSIESAAKAPVRGIYGGGAADTSPGDDFLQGFTADKW